MSIWLRAYWTARRAVTPDPVGALSTCDNSQQNSATVDADAANDDDDDQAFI